jgi:hypothetical protein
MGRIPVNWWSGSVGVVLKSARDVSGWLRFGLCGESSKTVPRTRPELSRLVSGALVRESFHSSLPSSKRPALRVGR